MRKKRVDPALVLWSAAIVLSPARSFSAARHCAAASRNAAHRARQRGAGEWRSRVEEKAATAAEKAPRLSERSGQRKELLALPGVGEKTAERILAYRDTYGKFVTVEQLLDVEGIGEGLLEQLRPYVYVEESE